MGPAVMSLRRARALLRDKPGSIESFGQQFVDRAEAAATLADHYREHPEELRQVRTADAWLARPKIEGGGSDIEPADPRDPSSGNFGAQHAKARPGATLVQVLPGDVSAYFVAADGQGRACLYRTVESDGAGDPGKITGDQRRRIVAADTMRSRTTLQSINERNRAAWAAR